MKRKLNFTFESTDKKILQNTLVFFVVRLLKMNDEFWIKRIVDTRILDEYVKVYEASWMRFNLFYSKGSN